MIDLPPEALAEIQRAKASSGANNSAMELPPEVLAEIQGYKQQKMVKNKGSDLLSQVQNVLKGITGGVAAAGAKTALGAASLLPDTAGPGLFGEGINRLSKSGETPKQAMTADLQPIIDAFNKQFGNSSLAQGFSGAVEALPYLAGPGEAELPQGLASLASKAPTGLKTLAKLGSGALKAAPINAGYGAVSYNPDKTTPEKMLEGGLVGTLFKGVTHGLTGDPLSSSKTSGEIKEALKLLKDEGVPVTASDVLGASSLLTNIQKNVLANIPLAGQASKFEEAETTMRGKVGHVLKNMLHGKNMQEVLPTVLSDVKADYHADNKEKESLYDAVDKYIEDKGIKYAEPLTHEAAQQELEKLNKGVGQQGRLLEDSELRGILEDLTTNIGDEYKYSKIGKKKLYHLKDETFDPHTKGVYSNVIKAREQDLRNIVESSGDEHLKGLLEKADNFYKEKMVKYQDEALQPFLFGKKTPVQAYKTFIKMGNTEDPEILKKFTNLLDDKNKSRLGAYMFKGALPSSKPVNLEKFDSIWSRIGDDTKELLFPAKDKQDLDRLFKLSGLTKTAREARANPNTGVMEARIKAISGILEAMGGYSLYQGNLKGAAGFVAPIVAARGAQSVINSPAFLKAVALLKQAQEKGLLNKSGAPALTNIAVRQ